MKNNLPQFEIWNQEPGIDGIYRQVERAGKAKTIVRLSRRALLLSA